jgi:predicted O-linked N-acetylglucosamine transferase (SPINDLY family)
MRRLAHAGVSCAAQAGLLLWLLTITERARKMTDLLQQASRAQQSGNIAEAEQLLGRLIAQDPRNAQALHWRGLALYQMGRLDDALRWIDQALKVNSRWPEALANQGVVLQALGKNDEALASYDRSLALMPRNPDTLDNRGNTLLALNRPADALVSYDAALKIQPQHVNAWNNRGNALRALRRLDDALASFDRALALAPGHFLIWNNRSTVARELKRLDEALTNAERALALKPDYADGWNSRGAALLDLHRERQALESFERALTLQRNHADAWSNRGLALYNLKRLPEALASFDQALALNPDHADALYFRGFTHQDMRQPDKAVLDFERLVQRDPGHRYALGGLGIAALTLNDWPRIGELMHSLRDDTDRSRSVLPPLLLLAYCDDPALQQRAARQGLRDRLPALPAPLWQGEAYRHDKIRLAYLSSDFHEHATAYLAAELFERHDRTAFEVIALSYGADDKSPMRMRLAKAFDRFVDVADKSDADVAKLIREMEVDILVDLKGHTKDARPEIISFRAAPVQVNYLGYPGSMGAPFVDYVIGDAICLPREQQPFYDEQIVHLPGTYQPNDTKRRVAPETPSRRQVGLPDDAFVFCSFNNNYKITAPVFAIWMCLLKQVPGSVLWLLADNARAMDNLRNAAAAHGIDPARLIFAPRIDLPRHLARHRLADLFLDTQPYNAHTTASDALWVGLPLVTRLGRTFAGRVAASLVTAAGLPELVTDTDEAYEALALALARDPARLKALRARLEAGRADSVLFDIERFRIGLETAYRRMVERARAGEPPQGFSLT